MGTYKAAKSVFASLAAASLVGCANMMPMTPVQNIGAEEPVDKRFEELGKFAGEQSKLRCPAAVNGDKSRGEFTNADITNLFSSGGIEKYWKDMSDERVGTRMGQAVSQGYVFCFNKNMRGLKNAAGEPVSVVFQVGAGKDLESSEPLQVIYLNPVAPDPKNARASMKLAIVDSVEQIVGAVASAKQLFMMRMALGGTLPPEAPTPESLIIAPVGIVSPLHDLNKLEDGRHVIADKAVIASVPSPGAKPPPEEKSSAAPSPRQQVRHLPVQSI